MRDVASPETDSKPPNIHSLNELAGRRAVLVISTIAAVEDNAKALHDAVEYALRYAGFDVIREFIVDTRESGVSGGRIDLLARYRGGYVAIELDNRSPRAGSLDKLRAFNTYRIIGLRGRFWPRERGIDAIINIPVRN